MSLKGRIAAGYARLFSRPAFVPLHRALFKLSVRGLGVLNHQDMVVSGEVAFLRRELGPRPRPLVLDVGAHQGEYARRVLATNPRALVHSFEPEPRSFAELARVEGLTGAYPLALSERAGTLPLYDSVDATGSQLATLVPGVFEGLYARVASSQPVEAITLDSFVASHGIEHVDLLKIDVEGHELEVLRGAASLLAERRVDWIQFEFGAPQLMSHASLRSFDALLAGFRLYRLLGSGLLDLSRLKPYERELYAYQNIVAQRAGT
jgi:FkbM family methyltransferase